MKILNIHGFRGDQHNAAYGALTDNGHEVISPATDYDSEKPKDILDKLRGIIDTESIDMLAGTSLGGFYAAVLSAEYGMPAVLINPCLMPYYHLPKLGYEGDIREYIEISGKLAALDAENIHCIIGGSDEVIDTHSFDMRLFGEDRITIIPEGMHSGATLPLKEYFKTIIAE